MDQINPEGPRGLVEFQLLKPALNRRLPTWPWASISSAPLWRRHAIMAAPGLTPGALYMGWTVALKCWLMDGKFPPINGEAERTRTKQQLGACPWVGPVWQLPLLRKRLPCKLFLLLHFVVKMSFLLRNDQSSKVVLLLSMFPPVFVFNLLPHETPCLDHNTPLLPTFCFKVDEAIGYFPKGMGWDFNPSLGKD